MIFSRYKREREILNQNQCLVIGCDEVGVGPVAGPVVAAACILNPESIGEKRSKSKWHYRVRDSKTVNEKEREELEQVIKSNCLAYGLGSVNPEVIDEINIHKASLLAMRKAIENMLEKFPLIQQGTGKLFVLVDGRFKIPDLSFSNYELQQEAIVDGDCQVLSIAAASIIAKVHRDNIMKKIHELVPYYGFDRHKGYNTKAHQRAIKENGVSLYHRKSFLKLVSQ